MNLLLCPGELVFSSTSHRARVLERIPLHEVTTICCKKNVSKKIVGNAVRAHVLQSQDSGRSDSYGSPEMQGSVASRKSFIVSGAGAPRRGQDEYCIALQTVADGYNAGRHYFIKFDTCVRDKDSSDDTDKCLEWIREISDARLLVQRRLKTDPRQGKLHWFQASFHDLYHTPLCRHQ